MDALGRKKLKAGWDNKYLIKIKIIKNQMRRPRPDTIVFKFRQTESGFDKKTIVFRRNETACILYI